MQVTLWEDVAVWDETMGLLKQWDCWRVVLQNFVVKVSTPFQAEEGKLNHTHYSLRFGFWYQNDIYNYIKYLCPILKKIDTVAI